MNDDHDSRGPDPDPAEDLPRAIAGGTATVGIISAHFIARTSGRIR